MKQSRTPFVAVVLIVLPLYYGTATPVGLNTPGSFVQTISRRPVSVSLERIEVVEDRSRVVIGSPIGNLRTNDEFRLSIIDQDIRTVDDLLSTTFVAVPCEKTDEFRLDSEKHSLYSITLEMATGNIVLNNTWGLGRNSNSSFVCFSYVSGALTVKNLFRFDPNSHGYVRATGFNDSLLGIDEAGNTFNITSKPATTTISVTDFAFDIPIDFDPLSTPYQPNKRVSWSTPGVVRDGVTSLEETILMSDLARQIGQEYASQVATIGWDDSTTVAAVNKLREIQSDLGDEGAHLRYHPEVYLAFRESSLSRTLGTASVVNGVMGQNTVPYVFFTNETDNSGVHHPFMVIASFSVHDVPFRLLDVPRPPGSGIPRGSGYAQQDVTRDALLANFQVKIPLRDYGEVIEIGANDMLTGGNTLADDEGERTIDAWNYASNSAIGIAIDGVLIYPVLNNTLSPAMEKGEVTNIGTHVGRGLNLHWHADGHSATGNGINLYNLPDYEGHDHPPLIGFGLDGVALYGKHESSFAGMDGTDVELNLFGGHEHGSYNYHYHAHSVESGDLGRRDDYEIHVLLKGAWAGKIGPIPNFWSDKNKQVDVTGHSIYAGFARGPRGSQ